MLYKFYVNFGLYQPIYVCKRIPGCFPKVKIILRISSSEIRNSSETQRSSETTQTGRRGSGVRIGMMFGGIIFVSVQAGSLNWECSVTISLLSTHLTNQQVASF